MDMRIVGEINRSFKRNYANDKYYIDISELKIPNKDVSIAKAYLIENKRFIQLTDRKFGERQVIEGIIVKYVNENDVKLTTEILVYLRSQLKLYGLTDKFFSKNFLTSSNYLKFSYFKWKNSSYMSIGDKNEKKNKMCNNNLSNRMIEIKREKAILGVEHDTNDKNNDDIEIELINFQNTRLKYCKSVNKKLMAKCLDDSQIKNENLEHNPVNSFGFNYIKLYITKSMINQNVIRLNNKFKLYNSEFITFYDVNKNKHVLKYNKSRDQIKGIKNVLLCANIVYELSFYLEFRSDYVVIFNENDYTRYLDNEFKVDISYENDVENKNIDDIIGVFFKNN